MAGRWLSWVALGATVALAACSDSAPEGTTEPQLHRGSSSSPTNACTISNTLVNNYFTGSSGQAIRALKDQLPAAGLGTANARTIGFRIMDSIGAVSRRSSTANASAGAALTIALITAITYLAVRSVWLLGAGLALSFITFIVVLFIPTHLLENPLRHARGLRAEP